MTNTQDIIQKPADLFLQLSGIPWLESPDKQPVSAAISCSAPSFIKESVWNMQRGFEPGKNCVSGGVFKKYPYLIINVPDRKIITPAGFSSIDPGNRWRLENRAFLFNLIEKIFANTSGVVITKSNTEINLLTFPEMLADWCVVHLPERLFSIESLKTADRTYFNGSDFYSTSGLLFIPFSAWRELPDACEISAAFENPPAFFDLADQSEGKYCIKAVRQGIFSPDAVCAAAVEEQGFAVFTSDSRIISVEPFDDGCIYILENNQSVAAPYAHKQKLAGESVSKWEVAGGFAKAVWNKFPANTAHKWWRQSRYISSGIWLYPCTGFNLSVPDITGKVEAYESQAGLSCIFPLRGDISEAAKFFAAAADAESRTGNKLADYLEFTAAGQYVMRNIVDLFAEFAIGSRGVIIDLDYSKIDCERFFRFIQNHAQAYRIYVCPPPEHLQ